MTCSYNANVSTYMSRVSCQKGPTRHACAWQIGPFWQDTLDVCVSSMEQSCVCNHYWVCTVAGTQLNKHSKHSDNSPNCMWMYTLSITARVQAGSAGLCQKSKSNDLSFTGTIKIPRSTIIGHNASNNKQVQIENKCEEIKVVGR